MDIFGFRRRRAAKEAARKRENAARVRDLVKPPTAANDRVVRVPDPEAERRSRENDLRIRMEQVSRQAAVSAAPARHASRPSNSAPPSSGWAPAIPDSVFAPGTNPDPGYTGGGGSSGGAGASGSWSDSSPSCSPSSDGGGCSSGGAD